MKEISMYRNGAFPAELEYETIESIGDADVVRSIEDAKAWDGYNFFTVPKGSHFVIFDGVAYPFSLPLYEADPEEGLKEQTLPETWEDIIGIVETFGR